MNSTTYVSRRGELQTYFDRTAVEAWKRLTSDAPVGRVRATVRAGRDRMRARLLSWLPDDLSGVRVLDAGCGTGALSVEAARRGAEVVAIDLSPTLVALAAERCPEDLPGRIEWRVGDMIDPSLGTFDYVVSMDSLIHYRAPDVASALAGLARQTSIAILFTFAPRTPALSAMLAVGRMIPRLSHRAPAIEPVSHQNLVSHIAREPGLSAWRPERTERISAGFYTSQAMELYKL
jgi:magnesium-protoporphyrin O-methyltransferase